MQPSPEARLLKQWLLTCETHFPTSLFFPLSLLSSHSLIPQIPSLQLHSSPTAHSYMSENYMQSQSPSAVQTFRLESKVRTNYNATFILPRFFDT